MTIQETAKIVNLLHTAFFHLDKTATVEDLANRIDLWAAEFIEYPYEIVLKVVKAWIKVNKWLPSVNEIIEACDIQLELQKKLEEAGSITALIITKEQEEQMEALLRFVYG